MSRVMSGAEGGVEGEATIERLDGRGRGVARDESGARLSIPGALPGERVAYAAEEGEEGEEARLLRVLEPVADRRTPPCPHAARCGGCALQHASDAFLAAWKRGLLTEALVRAGIGERAAIEALVAPTLTAPERSRRRVKLAGRRGKKGAELGFFVARSHRIEPIETCLIARREIVAALPALRELAALAAPRARPIALWVGVSESGLDLALEDAKPLDLALTERVTAWAEAADVARLSWNGEVLAARRPAWRRHGKALVAPPPGAFQQAAAEAETAMVAFAREALAGATRIADLFAGGGTFALPLAEAAEVLAVEADPGLLAALEAGWRAAPGLKRVAALRRDLFRRPLADAELKGLDAALFDPPRAGAEAQAAALAAAPARLARLVGVSCSPATFARDAAILAGGGWRLVRAVPIDQFRFSPHVELIALFER